MCNCEYENYGESGHSNDYIFRKVISLIKNWNSKDILLVQWTNPNRKELVTKEGFSFYSPWNNFMSLEFLFGQDVANNPKAKEFTNEKQKEIIKSNSDFIDKYTEAFINTDYQNNISECYQITLFNTLENLNVKHINFYGWDSIKLNVDNLTNDKFLKDTFGEYTKTSISDHPNLDGHINWAKYLFDKLKNFNYI